MPVATHSTLLVGLCLLVLAGHPPGNPGAVDGQKVVHTTMTAKAQDWANAPLQPALPAKFGVVPQGLRVSLQPLRECEAEPGLGLGEQGRWGLELVGRQGSSSRAGPLQQLGVRQQGARSNRRGVGPGDRAITFFLWRSKPAHRAGKEQMEFLGTRACTKRVQMLILHECLIFSVFS